MLHQYYSPEFAIKALKKRILIQKTTSLPIRFIGYTQFLAMISISLTTPGASMLPSRQLPPSTRPAFHPGFGAKRTSPAG
jgi:hypothetical protein